MTRERDASNENRTQREADAILTTREPGTFDDETRKDPEEVFFRFSAKKSVLMLDLFVSVALGGGMGAGLWYWLRYHLFAYSYYAHTMLLQVAMFAPAACMALVAIKRLYPLLASRYEVSRRFIRQSLFAGIDLVETTDMSKVVDISLQRLGPCVNLIIQTKDKTTPIIRMRYIDRDLGEKVFGFIAAHSIDSFTELRTPRGR